MSKEFNVLFEYLMKLRSRYFKTLSAFYVYEGILELGAHNIVGKKNAEKNVRTMNHFNNFFMTVRESIRVYFLLELAKLFDDSKQSLHVDKIIKFSGANMKRLSKKDFLKFHQRRIFIEELFKHYQELNQKDLEETEDKINNHKRIIEKIDKYRDQYLAHDDRQKKDIKISGKEITILFQLLEDILKLFTLRLDFSTTSYDRVEKDCKRDTKRVVEYLKRFEEYRLKEIEDKY